MNADWKLFNGKRRPVPRGTMVEVRYRDGAIGGPTFAEFLHWPWMKGLEEFDILMYRIDTEFQGLNRVSTNPRWFDTFRLRIRLAKEKT